MITCPTCGKRNVTQPICPRCQTDLSQIIGVEHAAEYFRLSGLDALKHGNRTDALQLASQACALHRTPANLALLAVIALANRDFDQARSYWCEIDNMGGYQTDTAESVGSSPPHPDNNTQSSSIRTSHPETEPLPMVPPRTDPTSQTQ